MEQDNQASIVAHQRSQKRKLIFWQGVGVAALVGLVLAVLVRADIVGHQDHLVRLPIEGVIFDDPERDELMRQIAEDEAVRAVVVAINSPGGTVVGGEALHVRLRQIAAEKPVVAVISELAASGGYMAALGADHIIARQGSITGSIGVIMQTTEITGLLDKLGVKPEAIKSGPLKAQPNPFEPFTDEAKEATRAVVLDSYELFVEMVAGRRGFDRDKALTLADGRIFTGRQALENGLIDAIGGEEEALAWLEKNHQISPDLPLETVTWGEEDGIWDALVGKIMGKAFSSSAVRLDGLLSVWHPGM